MINVNSHGDQFVLLFKKGENMRIINKVLIIAGALLSLGCSAAASLEQDWEPIRLEEKANIMTLKTILLCH